MKKTIALLLAVVMMLGIFAGCDTQNQGETINNNENQAQQMEAPKYVFLFIGDGMSYPQIQSTADYLGAQADEDYFLAQPSLDDNQGAILNGPKYLNFMNFEAAGSAVTYDSNSFAPDTRPTPAPSTWTRLVLLPTRPSPRRSMPSWV